MILDQATPDDAPAIIKLLWSRPAEGCETFVYAPQGWWMVCRDGDELAGFFICRWNDAERALVADRIEIEYAAGKPTDRGRQAYEMFAAELHRRADEAGCDVLAPVNIDNRVSILNLLSLGYEKEVVVMRRKPQASPAAVHESERFACR